MPFLQIRTQRTVPLICGTVKRFLLFGDHDGDVFATGGEMEIVQACDGKSHYCKRFYYINLSALGVKLL